MIISFRCSLGEDKSVLDNEFQEAAHSFGIRKGSARENLLKLRSDLAWRLRTHK